MIVGGRRFEIHPTLNVSRDADNVHREEWPGSTFVREHKFVNANTLAAVIEQSRRRAANHAAARVEKVPSCSRCQHPVVAGDVDHDRSAGRQWCRKCERKRKQHQREAAKRFEKASAA